MPRISTIPNSDDVRGEISINQLETERVESQFLSQRALQRAMTSGKVCLALISNACFFNDCALWEFISKEKHLRQTLVTACVTA